MASRTKDISAASAAGIALGSSAAALLVLSTLFWTVFTGGAFLPALGMAAVSLFGIGLLPLVVMTALLSSCFALDRRLGWDKWAYILPVAVLSVLIGWFASRPGVDVTYVFEVTPRHEIRWFLRAYLPALALLALAAALFYPLTHVRAERGDGTIGDR